MALAQNVIVAKVGEKLLENEHYLIFCDREGIGEEISNYLTSLNADCTLVTTGAEFKQEQEDKYQINTLAFENCDRLINNLKQENKLCQNVIYLQSLDSSSNNLETDIQSNTNAALYLTQALVKNNITQTNLYLVTRGATQEANLEGLSQSSLHGLTKVINLEHPELNCTCLDLDPQVDLKQQINNLITEIQSDSQAEQVIWRNNQRKIARLNHWQPKKKFLNLPEDKPYQLSISKKGTVKNLRLIPLERCQPEVDEVEIRVITTGLNFIDVLDTLGLLPFEKDWFGVECAGEIVAVGKDVTNFAIGDRVIALATGSFNQYVTVNKLMVVAKPDHLNWLEAVTIPANFLTAFYALETTVETYHGTSLQSKRILIHSAAGGTGMAAVQIAQLAGMEVFATASPSKWEFLKSLGIKHVMNSRTLDFADEILQITNGEGVDIVFNSLSGEFIDRSLSVLKDDGHFIEIGKRDIRAKEEIAKIKPNVSYSIVDLFSTAQQQPNVIQSLFTKLVAKFATGELKPLPYKEFSLEQTISAFQYMQQAKHIGKIVVTHDNPVGTSNPKGLASRRESSLKIDADKTYLIAGGLGDLGLLVANWLAEKGAKYLLLIGRNQPSEYAKQQINQLEQKQVTVTIAQADIADYNSLGQTLNSYNLSPLAGIIHSAGVLDDGMLVNMDSERMQTVMNPKVLGAWNLHQLTKDMSLDFFIMFSSAASLLGSPGQTNHVVANTFLDTLAHYRKAQGLPGLSLNWGAWSDIGEAARRKADRQMNLKGIGSIAPQEGLVILEKLFNQSSPQVGIVPIDWSRFIAAGYNLPLVEDFKQIKQSSEISTSSSNFLSELQAINPEHQLKFLITFLQKEVGKVLGLSANQLPSVSQGFFDIGMDSLMAIELKNKLENNLQATISSTVIFEHSNIEQLANYIFDEVLHLETPKAESDETVEAELSPEELENAIAQELADLESLL